MKKEIRRQGMVVSVKELIDLADELEGEGRGLSEYLGEEYDFRLPYLISIINKTNESDTWEIEK